ncbi:MAG TPA: DUF3160 domain-containing protein [Polyangiaceae bacterium]|nr:DUF3160 domain-containing protein [Polyangiaceae bacterium]
MNHRAARGWVLWLCALSAGACAVGQRIAGPSAATRPALSASAPVLASAPSSPSALPAPSSDAPVSQPEPLPDVEQLYRAHLAAQRELEFPELERELSLARQPDAPLSFDPTTARYAAKAITKLALSPEERSAFQRDGVVNLDHGQRYSMASAYYAIFTRDLPLLVTTDSILHALHRSYDAILAELETSAFSAALALTLAKSHESLRRAPHTPRALDASYGDVDLYLTVAQNLLAGPENAAQSQRALPVPSLLGNDARAKAILRQIAALSPAKSELYGGRRVIDYSQFKARGHYSASPELTRYFQALMWLGRADTAFVLAPPDKSTGLQVDAERELRSATLLALAVEHSGELESFEAMARTIDFLVGNADNLTLRELLSALRSVGVAEPSELAQPANMLALREKVLRSAHQQIRSQVLLPPRTAPEEAPPPAVFQLIGQRFLLDSFLLSRVVYDSIWFKGEKVARMMPSGLDVMAALGNDEAARLLRPELERFNYAANLLAARRTVDELRPAQFEQSVATLWLDALRKLDDAPARGQFPEAMKRTPFMRKQLQTQLASWAELRHDTALYGKQSYTAGYLCEYPEGYVEPYPEFFARLRLLAKGAEQHLAALPRGAGYASFFANFAETMKRLENMAQKELDAQAFTAEERAFLKKAIDISGVGCGPPRYDGWYTRLFYGGRPEAWKPVVSDVHTDPTTERVLQEGVGDANFIVIAVDNQQDRAVYVGPVYSYYEFTHELSDRLTDEQWRNAIERQKLPERPEWWTQAFPAKAQRRELPRVARPPG